MNIRRYTAPLSFILVTTLIFLLQACGSGGPTQPNFNTGPHSYVLGQGIKDSTQLPLPYNRLDAVRDSTGEDGVQIFIINQGTGSYKTVSRDQPLIRFVGRTKKGKVIESSFLKDTTNTDYHDVNQFLNLTPITKTVVSGYGRRQISAVMKGFRRGILGMVEGEKRQLVIPPSLGFKDVPKGSKFYDLRNDTLVYDVKLVDLAPN